MHIANPIYDVVFKYLLDDNKTAKKLLSAIIGEDIVKLTMLPTEIHSDKHSKTLTVYRVDFAAKIRTKRGKYKTVLIEIQKAKFPTDIIRFRRYLGENYISKENTYVDEKTGHIKARPIITIYFLGHKLEHLNEPVIHVKRKYYDRITGKEIKTDKKEEFIEALTHDSFIIQIPQLKQRRKNELLQILSIFDQSQCVDGDTHVLDIDEEHYPEKYREVIRRLVKAISEKKVRDTMEVEDDILEELECKERFIESLKEKAKDLEEEKLREAEARRKAEEESRRVEQEKRKLEEEKRRAEEERRKAEEEKLKLYKILKSKGISVD